VLDRLVDFARHLLLGFGAGCGFGVVVVALDELRRSQGRRRSRFARRWVAAVLVAVAVVAAASAIAVALTSISGSSSHPVVRPSSTPGPPATVLPAPPGTSPVTLPALPAATTSASGAPIASPTVQSTAPAPQSGIAAVLIRIDCPELETDPALLSCGQLDVPLHHLVVLDAITPILTDILGPTCDLAWLGPGGLVGCGGGPALAVLPPGSQPSRTRCVGLTDLERSVPIDDLRDGTLICVRTRQGRTVLAQVQGDPASEAIRLKIAVWGPQPLLPAILSGQGPDQPSPST
jgi:hypothetical protein